ncbi:MAG: hypothetical protein D6693_07085 [Planctomycetota bacterium]|nr:MAG: hypothetical protein D6693_07085 [Planctomycetota bacterium]
MADHDRDLVHELSNRVDFVWRVDQYIANAEGHGELAALWRDLKRQELATIERMRSLVKTEIEAGCF